MSPMPGLAIARPPCDLLPLNQGPREQRRRDSSRLVGGKGPDGAFPRAMSREDRDKGRLATDATRAENPPQASCAARLVVPSPVRPAPSDRFFSVTRIHENRRTPNP
ncbi:hypothetical protein ROR02_06100 [Pararhodospirillum oryzae]|uniref:Uncharacterized protein n=1 Tax=Pararhodospirillum oryzae TaxID=478448 RepID=A0A512H4T3_9PROT|nr:hypothetical protein ROR02_06100 [Pararhodospirillum oryzae]